MRTLSIIIAAAAAVLVSTGVMPGSAAMACASPDPDDCSGLSAEERARDRAEIRRLNRNQLRYVERRDAEYARGWDATRRHQDDIADYEAERREYERQMAEWRDAVRRCRAGDWRYCDS